VPTHSHTLTSTSGGRCEFRAGALTLNEIPRCHIRVKILYATGLRKADCCATISGDPYAVLFREGKKVGRTPTRKKSTNPVWGCVEIKSSTRLLCALIRMF